jgi:hypothetical protein
MVFRAMPVRILLKHHLWITWAGIAARHEADAWSFREEGLRTMDPNERAEVLPKEFDASLIGLTAVSHSIDGLYGELIEFAPSLSRRS